MLNMNYFLDENGMFDCEDGTLNYYPHEGGGKLFAQVAAPMGAQKTQKQNIGIGKEEENIERSEN